jgi:hypothetical protein
MTDGMPEEPPRPDDGEQESAEYADPFEGMDFRPFDPAEAVSAPQGTPLGTGEDTTGDPGGFDPRYREDFEGLAFLGALEARFSYIGHQFVIRTLTTDELLAASSVIKEYEGTLAAARAYATVMAALSVVSVDGTGLPSPIGENDNPYAWAHERFDYVKARWFPYTVDYVYEKYLLLEERVRAVLVEMTEQAKKAGSQAGSTPG